MNERYGSYKSKKVDKVSGKCELITHKKMWSKWLSAVELNPR